MHFNDESLQELSDYFEMPEPPSDAEVSEADYYEKDRMIEQQQADCAHEDASEEPIGQIHYSGAVELYLVCHTCGATRPTGKYDSIL